MMLYSSFVSLKRQMNAVSVNLMRDLSLTGWSEFWRFAAGQTSFVSSTHHSNSINESCLVSTELVDVLKTCLIETRACLDPF